jgi:ribosomal protein S8
MTVHTNLSFLISRIKNASKHNKSFVKVPRTNLNYNCLKTLYVNGYLNKFCLDDLRDSFIVELKLESVRNDLSTMRMISTASRRVFLDFKEISKKYKVEDFFLVSTSKGILLGSEVFFYGLGGEILVDNLNY